MRNEMLKWHNVRKGKLIHIRKHPFRYSITLFTKWCLMRRKKGGSSKAAYNSLQRHSSSTIETSHHRSNNNSIDASMHHRASTAANSSSIMDGLVRGGGSSKETGHLHHHQQQQHQHHRSVDGFSRNSSGTLKLLFAFMPNILCWDGRLKPSCKLYVFEIKQPIHRSDHFF